MCKMVLWFLGVILTVGPAAADAAELQDDEQRTLYALRPREDSGVAGCSGDGGAAVHRAAQSHRWRFMSRTLSA
jgi:hypothetical protein